jgi:hypothetical protein
LEAIVCPAPMVLTCPAWSRGCRAIKINSESAACFCLRSNPMSAELVACAYFTFRPGTTFMARWLVSRLVRAEGAGVSVIFVIAVVRPGLTPPVKAPVLDPLGGRGFRFSCTVFAELPGVAGTIWRGVPVLEDVCAGVGVTAGRSIPFAGDGAGLVLWGVALFSIPAGRVGLRSGAD